MFTDVSGGVPPKPTPSTSHTEVTMRKVAYNHRGTVGFAVGVIVMLILSVFIYNTRYGQLSTESAIVKEAFSQVDYNNQVIKERIADNVKQNEIINEHVPKYLEQVGKTLMPRQQKVVEVNEDSNTN